MKIKYGQLKDVMDMLRNKGSLSDQPNHEISITLREEDPGAGVLVECVVISTVVMSKPNQYDSYKGDITTEYTVEIFADSENRPPRWTAVETRDLIK